MLVRDLSFVYPEELVATEPHYPSRVLWCGSNTQSAEEIAFTQLIERIPSGDLLILNDTKVLKRRVFSDQIEILFLNSCGPRQWEVLFPSRHLKVGDVLPLPEGLQMKLIRKGRPQVVEVNADLSEDYFQRVAELPLPPYIQKARAERHNRGQDESWYQTAWAAHPGSFAAPTASLHFKSEDIDILKKKGVRVLHLTLHVGLGTFLPVTSEDLDQHDMHEEYVRITGDVWQQILEAKKEGRKIWALGTTATRSLESAASGLLNEDGNGGYSGNTKLLIQPGYEWKIVDRLLTNFHQPESTLLALVAAFSNLEKVKRTYDLAIEKRFRLFSYGDLSVWLRESL